jgi:hypothetical protein
MNSHNLVCINKAEKARKDIRENRRPRPCDRYVGAQGPESMAEILSSLSELALAPLNWASRTAFGGCLRDLRLDQRGELYGT